ncbi:hypothetical protein ACFE04_017455 [Oxalis oulophora]
MAPTILSSSSSSYFLLILSLYFSNKCCCYAYASASAYAFEGRKIAEESQTHSLIVSSLIPSSICSSSSTASNKRASSLEVTHRHGPCSKLTHKKEISHTDILRHDQARVNSIHSKLAKTRLDRSAASGIVTTESTKVPAVSGETIGTGNYIVTVGLGSPKKDLSLVFDTGSDLTWTQCEPCVGTCYDQKEPIFDPTKSTSYTNISCGTTECSSLISATGNTPRCSSSTCVYGIQYGDSSFSVGFFGRETLTLGADEFKNFLFGCGENNQGLFVGAAGLLGLGRDKLSFVSQSSAKYSKIFSYCLPSTSSSTGFISFGGGVSKSVKYTPLSAIAASDNFYGLDITGISVGGKKLAISASVFSTGGAIIDSGTVITRLPPNAYSNLKSAFKSLMTKYKTAAALSILDTCYDFSKYKTISVPKISFFFGGGLEVPLDLSGILYAGSLSQVCLAFAANSDASDVAILGNTQQKTLEVVYDGVGGRVGFGSGGCS